MASALTISLTLNSRTCIRGESVSFEIVLANGGERPCEVLSFEPDNRAVRLVARLANAPEPVDSLMLDSPYPPDAIVGYAAAMEEREGTHNHGPDQPALVTMPPGGKQTETGDILQWLGELPPGTYKVAAWFEGAADMFISEPVVLEVVPAKPIVGSAPRPGERGDDAPFPAAWTHAIEGGQLVFYQIQSERMPRNPRRGVRAAAALSVDELTVAALPTRYVTTGHVLWLEKNRLHIVPVEPEKLTAGKPLVVKPGLAGSLLLSPLSMPDGSVLVPMADAKRKRAAVVRVDAEGKVETFDIDLGKASPLGPHCCCWELDRKLHFGWAKPNGREIFCAVMFLDEPSADMPIRSVHISDNPIVWMEMYLDRRAAMAAKPMFDHNASDEDRQETESPPPKFNLWSVSTREGQLVCTRVKVSDNTHQAEVVLDAEKLGQLRVVNSALRSDNHLAMLLAGEAGTLYYASTKTRSIAPLETVAGLAVTLEQQPALMTASRMGVWPWVYLRYLDAKEGRIAYAKIEPAEEAEPTHHAH